MRKPRKLVVAKSEWFAVNRKELMQRYVKDRSGLLWGPWLAKEYEVYIGR